MYPRRKMLRLIAGAPLFLTFGFAGEALLRFAKPTMKPFGVFDPADLPKSVGTTFSLSDFPKPWTCIPFSYDMTVAEFNAENHEIRKIPAFAIRLATKEIVAYSRICPAHGCTLNYIPEPFHNCGCAPSASKCCCAVNVANPVLQCPCDRSTFDLARDGAVIDGPAPRPPRRIALERVGDLIACGNLEVHGII